MDNNEVIKWKRRFGSLVFAFIFFAAIAGAGFAVSLGRLAESDRELERGRKDISVLTGTVNELKGEQQRTVKLVTEASGIIDNAAKQTGNALEKLRGAIEAIGRIEKILRSIADSKL